MSDESVSFSLKELMKLEGQRVDEEKAVREAARQEARAKEEEVARVAKLAAQAEEAEKERARARAREEDARLEAMDRAAVEQARITVEARARAEEAERERAHEREIVRLRIEAQKKPGVGALVGSGLGGVAVALVGAFVIFFAVMKPAQDRELAEQAGIADTERARANAQAERANGASEKLQNALKDLAEARRPPPPATALAAPTPPIKPPGHAPGGGAKLPPASKDADKLCDRLDPLCFHIP